MKEIASAYEPQKYEDKIYADWEAGGFFNPDNLPDQKSRKKIFSMVMPPPNVTGTLHVGHAAMLALEDILTRFYRMRGYSALWIPGSDHAAIATQTKVEKILKSQGKSRYDLDREGFLAEVEKFAAVSKATIFHQVRKVGCSCDWSREAYTLDAPRTLAVRTVFKKMFDDGLIYRGDRVVNWCPQCASTLADDEVEHEEQEAMFYTFKYAKDFPFAISTTRPETKLGDTAVAVNPNDKRYKKYVGKEFNLDFAGQRLHIRVISDRGVDMDFGTGALGVTPAHSMVDYEMAQKNNLKIRKVIGEDGKITAEAGKYVGMTTLEAREKIVAELRERGLIGKEEKIKNSLSVCYRCGTAIEPLPSKQWFLDVNKKLTIAGNKYFKNKSIKEVSLAVVKKGEIKIMPANFEKIYFHWMENLRDWCISRQIWFGHRIPVWYKDRETFVGVEAPKGDGWRQDGDTLDTWFSSGLWTFSTLGWPVQTLDLKKFHPTTVLETGYDILFFWVARMIIMTTYVLGEVPFENVYLHGLVRDESGRKMSKSLGNVIDPLVVGEKYGMDAVRLSLIMGASPGNDAKLSEEKIAGFRNFSNKLWNISRYIMTKKQESDKAIKQTLADKWIAARFNQVVGEVTRHLEKYEFSAAGEKLRDFTWEDFADWYLEIAKIEGNKGKILQDILEKMLVLWHPFIPFVTEAIWNEMLEKKDLIVASWPKVNKTTKQESKKTAGDFEKIKSIITAIRNLRSEYKVEPGKKVRVILVSKTDAKLLEAQRDILKGLGRVESLEIKIIGKKPNGFSGAVAQGIGIYLDLAGAVDMEKEKARLGAELANKEKYLAGLSAKLKNKYFVARAPKAVIAVEQEKMTKAAEEVKNLKEQLKNL
jgi:valyl-tRNA synthetase